MSALLEDRWKLIQRLALLAYVHRGEESKELYKAVIGAKILKGFYDDCTKQDLVKKSRCTVDFSAFTSGQTCSFFGSYDTTQNNCFVKEEAILAIAQYVKSHPRASEKDIQCEVEKQIAVFAEKIR